MCPIISEWSSETGVGRKSVRGQTEVRQGLDGGQREVGKEAEIRAMK